MKYNFITIEGCIGAGKTTLATKLAERFGGKLILEQFEDNPFLPQFYEDPERHAFPVELYFMAERFQHLKRLLSEADMFIYTGAEMEPWAQELADSVDMSKVKVVDASSGVSMMKEEDEEHEHAEAEEDSAHAEEDSHDHSSHHHEHDGTYSPPGRSRRTSLQTPARRSPALRP